MTRGNRWLKKLRRLNIARIGNKRDPSTLRTDWKKVLGVLAPLKKLEALDLSGNSHEHFGDNELNAGLAELKKFKNLRELALAGLPITDEGAAHLKDLAGLRRLDFSGTKTTDKALTALRGLKGLEELRCNSGGSGVQYLKALRRLSVRGDATDRAAVRDVATLPDLEELDASATQRLSGLTSPEDVKPLAGLKKLRRLNLSGHRSLRSLKWPAIAQFKDMPALQELGLSWTKVADTDPGALTGLKALRVLKLVVVRNRTGPGSAFNEGPMPGAGNAAVARFATLPALEQLDLAGTAVTDAGMKPLAAARKLRRLALDWTKVTDAGLEALASSPSLQRLELSHTSITNEGLAALENARALEELDVSYTKVTDAGLKTIGKMKQLTYHDLSGTAITHAGVAELAGLQKLRVLALWNTNVTNAAIPHIAKLKGLRTVYSGQYLRYPDFFPYDPKTRRGHPAIPGLKAEW